MLLTCLCAPLRLLVSGSGHPGGQAAGSIWAADIPAWVSAIATAGLLIGAIFTAVYARRAFDGQTEQLAEQRKINGLQAKDLEASLKERERLRQITEREQASAVSFYWWPAIEVLTLRQPPTAVEPGISVLVIDNGSNRRIVNATCRAGPSGGAGLTLAAEETGQLTTDHEISSFRAILNRPAGGSVVPLIRGGSKYGFLLRLDLHESRGGRLAARFTDDESRHWQIDQDLHLEALENRADW
jgi:hypothetical protein